MQLNRQNCVFSIRTRRTTFKQPTGNNSCANNREIRQKPFGMIVAEDRVVAPLGMRPVHAVIRAGIQWLAIDLAIFDNSISLNARLHLSPGTINVHKCGCRLAPIRNMKARGGAVGRGPWKTWPTRASRRL
jgi:hypothetical protein